VESKPSRVVVAYLRVSTDRQGINGLGMDAQRAAVRAFAQQHNAPIVAEYREAESGRNAARPELAKAICHARRIRATLLIAKLDRLARNVAFVAALMDSDVDFVACDNPTANRLTLHILAAVAEDEARRISERTRAALAAYKRRGGRLGTHDPRCRVNQSGKGAEGGLKGATVMRQRALAADVQVSSRIREMRRQGLSLRAIAERLNQLGHSSRTGRAWSARQVLRVLKRASYV
jgi:DNA invertase Pin-like site-specific DNA recombinase